MKLVVCAVRDSAVDAFMRPIFVPSTGVAVRSFRDEVLRAESDMFRHASDYELFEIASYDEESGRFENLSSPRSLVRGADIKES